MTFFGYSIIACLIFLQFACSQNKAKTDGDQPQLTAQDLATYTDAKPKLPSHDILLGVTHAPVELEFKYQKDRVEISSECFTSVMNTYIDKELRNKKTEAVEFKVKTTTTRQDPNTHGIVQVLETFYKDGPTDLHELAMPEKGEKIEFIYSPKGDVLKAGGYPKNSIFYLPPLPLPDKPVRVGDTWEQESKWSSSPQDNYQLRSRIVARFEGWKSCGKSECAEIRVAGVVNLPQKLEEASHYKHHLTGLFWLEPKTGLVPWVDFRSEEQVQANAALIDVHSSLRSWLLQPQGYYKASHEELACPSEKSAE